MKKLPTKNFASEHPALANCLYSKPYCSTMGNVLGYNADKFENGIEHSCSFIHIVWSSNNCSSFNICEWCSLFLIYETWFSHQSFEMVESAAWLEVTTSSSTSTNLSGGNNYRCKCMQFLFNFTYSLWNSCYYSNHSDENQTNTVETIQISEECPNSFWNKWGQTSREKYSLHWLVCVNWCPWDYGTTIY